MAEEYRTLQAAATAEFTEKRSRFIGYARPVTTEEEALAFIAEIKKRHWDARHNPYAYVLREGQTRRYSDDGEPQGTAGVPILEVLQKQGLTDCAVVVTRYFGGILLGGGGLVRAYGHGASIAVQAAGIERRCLCQTARLSCDYAQYGRVQPLLLSMGGVAEDVAYADGVTITFHIPTRLLDPFEAELTDATAGTVSCEVLGEAFWPFAAE